MATLLQKTDKDRLDVVLKRIEEYSIRFPIAELTKALKADKGNVSAMLKGKKPISDNFYTSFNTKYPPKSANEGKAVEFTADRDKLIIEMLKEIIRLSAKVDTLTITLADIVSKVDKKAIPIVDSELIESTNQRSEALLKEWKKKVSGL